jgi:hypothetical protein
MFRTKNYVLKIIEPEVSLKKELKKRTERKESLNTE